MYSSDGLSMKIALTILIVYCLVVLVHITQTSITGNTSTSWNSIAELFALAMQSPPTSKLHNTSAGIASLNTFKAQASVRITQSAEEKTAGDLYLLIGEDMGKDTRGKVRYDTAY